MCIVVEIMLIFICQSKVSCIPKLIMEQNDYPNSTSFICKIYFKMLYKYMCVADLSYTLCSRFQLNVPMDLISEIYFSNLNMIL